MISRVCFCFRLSRVSYSLYCNKLSVHNNINIISLVMLLVAPISGLTVKISRFS